MKKISLLVIFICAALLLMTGCKVKKSSTINYQRKFDQYMPSGNSSSAPGTIDLSDGSKLRYDGNIGPSDVDFDIKIRNPY